MKKLFKKLEETLTKGENAVLCSIIKSSGSTPRGSGAKMLVFENGEIYGTIGGGAVEFHAIMYAKELHSKKICDIRSYCLAPNDAAGLGMVCGGNITVCFQYFSYTDEQSKKLIKHINGLFDKSTNAWLIMDLEQHSHPVMSVYDADNKLMYGNIKSEKNSELILKNKGLIIEDRYFTEPIIKSGFVYVFGGGHISQELVPLIAHVGFRPVVFEDIEAFAQEKLFPDAEKIILGDFSKLDEFINVKSEDYIAIMTRGHKNDYDAVKFAVKSKASYIGLIGSRSKMSITIDRLKSDGISENDIKRIHNPIGLDIKAETPAEIAVSVTAQLILHRALASSAAEK